MILKSGEPDLVAEPGARRARQPRGGPEPPMRAHEKGQRRPVRGRLRVSSRDHAAPAPARLTPPRGLPSRGG